MDSDNDSYHFPKCQTHAYTRFENGCSENSTQKLLTKYSMEENNKHVIYRPRSVRIGKNCALGLGRVRPSACGLGPYSRPQAQFFPIRTSRPANNIYVVSIVIGMSWFYKLRWTNFVSFLPSAAKKLLPREYLLWLKFFLFSCLSTLLYWIQNQWILIHVLKSVEV